MIKRSDINNAITTYRAAINTWQRRLNTLLGEAAPLRALADFGTTGTPDADLSLEELARLVLIIEQGLNYYSLDSYLNPLFRKLVFKFKLSLPIGYQWRGHQENKCFWIYLALTKQGLFCADNIDRLQRLTADNLKGMNILCFNTSLRIKTLANIIELCSEGETPDVAYYSYSETRTLMEISKQFLSAIPLGTLLNQTLFELLVSPLEDFEEPRRGGRGRVDLISPRYSNFKLLLDIFNRYPPPANYLDYLSSALIHQADALDDLLKKVKEECPHLFNECYLLVLQYFSSDATADTKGLGNLLHSFSYEKTAQSDMLKLVQSNPRALKIAIQLNKISVQFLKDHLITLTAKMDHGLALAEAYATAVKGNKGLLPYLSDLTENPQRAHVLAAAYIGLIQSSDRLFLEYKADLLDHPGKETMLATAYMMLYNHEPALIPIYRRYLLAAPDKAVSLTKAYCYLHKINLNSILETSFHEDLLDHPYPYELTTSLLSLCLARIEQQSQTYYLRIKEHLISFPKSADILFHLVRNNALHPTEFESVLQYADIFSDEAFFNATFGHQRLIPEWNRDAFSVLVAICEQATVETIDLTQATARALKLLMEWYDDRAIALEENAQSTHLASIHQSSSASALRLKHRYADQLDTEASLTTQMQAIRQWIEGLDLALPKHQAAKHLFDNIQSNSVASRGHFIDPVSHVSLRELLVLFWCAIHDPSQCKTPLDEAQSSLL